MSALKDRVHAGKMLSECLRLNEIVKQGPTIVLALPRGGVPVGFEIAKKFRCELDVMIVRKLGIPFQPEVAMGAISIGDVQVLNADLIHELGITQNDLSKVIQAEKWELERRNKAFRQGKPFPSLENKIVLIVDDGIATGATMKAAILAAKAMNPKKVIAVAPVGPPTCVAEIANMADEVICPIQPIHFNAVGLWYENFPQTDDKEVVQLLHEADMMIHDKEQ